MVSCIERYFVAQVVPIIHTKFQELSLLTLYFRKKVKDQSFSIKSLLKIVKSLCPPKFNNRFSKRHLTKNLYKILKVPQLPIKNTLESKMDYLLSILSSQKTFQMWGWFSIAQSNQKQLPFRHYSLKIKKKERAPVKEACIN